MAVASPVTSLRCTFCAFARATRRAGALIYLDSSIRFKRHECKRPTARHLGPCGGCRPGAGNTAGSSGGVQLLAAYPWLGYVLPLVLFLAVTSSEPKPPEPADQTVQTEETPSWFDLAIPYRAYPIIYTAKIALTIGAMLFVWPVYRQFPFHSAPWRSSQAWSASRLGLGCVTGARAARTASLGLGGLLGSGTRSAFNPLVELAGPTRLGVAVSDDPLPGSCPGRASHRGILSAGLSHANVRHETGRTSPLARSINWPWWSARPCQWPCIPASWRPLLSGFR